MERVPGILWKARSVKKKCWIWWMVMSCLISRGLYLVDKNKWHYIFFVKFNPEDKRQESKCLKKFLQSSYGGNSLKQQPSPPSYPLHLPKKGCVHSLDTIFYCILFHIFMIKTHTVQDKLNYLHWTIGEIWYGVWLIWFMTRIMNESSSWTSVTVTSKWE